MAYKSEPLANVPNTETNSRYAPAPVDISGISGGDVPLTGYAIGTTALAPVAASDTVIAAIAKLEKRIADLESA